METIKKRLSTRREKLIKMKKATELGLQGAPEGSIRLCHARGTVQYYLRTDPKDFKGKYIPQKDEEFIRKIMQKDYDQKILCSIEQEIKAIDKFLSMLPERRVEDVYATLHRARQELIVPVVETDEQIIRRWEQEEYQGKEIDESIPILLTEKGERVRSKSEMMIADLLHREGVSYKYECPINLKGFGKVYPDFTMLNIRRRKIIYWEHFGRMDDMEYVEKAIRKIKAYEQNGIHIGDNLIVTWESKKNPISQGELKRQIQRFFE